MNTLVSIIMPCYNSELFVAQAIDSVLHQTYQNWELLIIDDCSSDNSVTIIKHFCISDKRIKLLTTVTPSGSPTIPRNIGIQNAGGRFIAFLDSDDMWLPEKLEQQIPLFSHDNVAVVFSWYEKINESGMRKSRVVKSPQEINYKQLLKGNCIGNLTGVYDTKKVNKVYQKLIHHEDYVMWLEILDEGYSAKNTNTCLALYRQHNTSISKKKIATFSWQWNIYRKELNFSLYKSCFFFGFYVLKAFIKYLT